MTMELDLFVFAPDGAPPYEVWAPCGMVKLDQADSDGVLVQRGTEGFTPNIVFGHSRIDAATSTDALITRLSSDAMALPDARLRPQRTLEGAAGAVEVVSYTHAGPSEAGPLYQMIAVVIAPAGQRGVPDDERALIFLTAGCTVDQEAEWDPAFVEVARSVRI